MRVYVDQKGLDELAAGNELRIASDIADPLGRFPGETWCEGNWADLRIDGYFPWDFSTALDPSYFLPARQGVTDEQFSEQATQSFRKHTATAKTRTSTSLREWAEHVKAHKTLPKFHPCGPGAKGEFALTGWSQLQTYRHPSAFAILVDPYLLSSQRESAAVRANNVAELLLSVLDRVNSDCIEVAIFCDWGSRPPRQQGRDYWEREFYLTDEIATAILAKLQAKNLANKVRITYVEATSALLALPRSSRLHDRFLLTQDYTIVCGTGFGTIKGRPNFSEVVVTYNFGNRQALQSFSNRLGECRRYLEACRTKLSQAQQLREEDFVSLGKPADLLGRLDKVVQQSFGDSLTEL